MTDRLSAGMQVAHNRATIVRFFLITYLLLMLAAIGSTWMQHSMLVGVLDGARLTTADAEANDARERLLAIVRLLLFIGTIVAWLRWQHRAYANLQLIGSRETEQSPGWSVGYWFIPIINIYKPYQITSELYRRSEIQNGRDTIGGLSSPPLVGMWWFAYLAWGGTERWFTVIAKDAHTLPTLISATNIELAAHMVGALACVLALQVVRSIDQFQQAFPAHQPQATV